MFLAVVMLGVLVVGLVVVIGLALQMVKRREESTEAQLLHTAADTVLYEVPEGVDPSGVEAALRSQGYVTAVETHHGDEFLRIACRGSEREHVRAVIGEIQQTEFMPKLDRHTVHFSDEH